VNIHNRRSCCPQVESFLVRRILEAGEPPVEVAAAMGVSPRTVYR
jgi:hypothetical protein